MNYESNVILDLKKSLESAFIDKSIDSKNTFQPKLITNNYQERRKVLPYIEKELSSCDSFIISVAFITNGGIEPLMQIFKELETKGVRGKILTTDYLHFSEPTALKRLIGCFE